MYSLQDSLLKSFVGFDQNPTFFPVLTPLWQLISQSSVLSRTAMTLQMINDHYTAPKDFNTWPVGYKNHFNRIIVETLEHLIQKEQLSQNESLAQVSHLAPEELISLKKLYAKGIRNNHLIDLRKHFVENYRLELDALEDFLLNQNLTLDEALTKVTTMDSSDFMIYID